MINRSKAVLVSAILSATLLTSCGAVPMQVKSEDRDVAGLYDGVWNVAIAKGRALQYVQNWQFTCGDMSSSFHIAVDDGTIELESSKTTVTGYVSDKGRFKIYLPIEGDASASGRSDSSINNGERKVVLRGRLGEENGVGYITYGIAEFGYAGCTSKARFKRVDPKTLGQAT